MTQFQQDVARSIKTLAWDKPSIIRCAGGETVVVQTAEQKDPTQFIFGIRVG